jgi:hypothetical protein
MNNNDLGRVINITSVFGIMAFITVPITAMLYFMYSDVPPIWNVLLRTLLSIVGLVFILIFFSGFQYVIRNLNIRYDWIATTIFSTVCIYLATNFVAHSLEAGSVLNPEGVAIDATQDGILAQGNYLLYGSIGRILTATFMMEIGILTIRSRLFPLWSGWVALTIAIINIAFIPSMFFGTNAGDFYSAVGWGNSALTASLYIFYILIMSIIMLKNKKNYMKE